MKNYLTLLRKLLLFIALIAVVVVAIIYSLNNQMGDNDSPSKPPINTENGNAQSIPLPDDAQAAKVKHIHDGDTLFLEALESGNQISEKGEVKVRLVGIDTPEVSSPKECYGDEATNALKNLIPVNSTVWVSTDREPYDKYDRMLLYIWNEDGTFVNLQMVADGYAEAIKVRPNDYFYAELKQAENEAYSANIGMWGKCNY
ncbi:MAG: thermonuclease family protein [Microbacteriaceae bacterium]